MRRIFVFLSLVWLSIPAFSQVALPGERRLYSHFCLVRDDRTPADTLFRRSGVREEVRFGTLETVSGPYYEWPVLREWLQRRISLFVSR